MRIAPRNGKAEKGQYSVEVTRAMLEERFQNTTPVQITFPRLVGMLLE